MGSALNATFQPGQTSLDGVSIPYAGWVSQMTACTPTVAQALAPYPQYCGGLYGTNEPDGNSYYQAFQFTAKKQMSHGLWYLASYTWSKTIDNVEDTNSTGGFLSFSSGETQFSPYQRSRAKSLASDDLPQNLSIALVYDLPFGKGQRFANRGGVVGKVVGGWEASTIFRAASGLPQEFRDFDSCNVPAQFRSNCIPGIVPGADPFAQSKSNLNLNKPLFNVAAFEPASTFNFYFGQGPRISDVRGFGLHDNDWTLRKMIPITERVNLQIRADFFNLWNWHMFANTGEYGVNNAFINDVASPTFGMWNGIVTAPRTIQAGARIEF
jgi:hypothetical protein